MSQRIRVNVTPTPNFVGFNSTRREQVIDMLATALEIGHRVSDGHERWEFTLPHNHPPIASAASNKADATDAGTHAETPR